VKAREELIRWSGKQFSQPVVEAFLRALDRENVTVS
jgi:HD-GYP domain-containing protein (c-di-GMP phosphodiesterase class II)